MNSKNPDLKIAVVGNSVSLRVRPPESYPNNKNYHGFLQDPSFTEEITPFRFHVVNLANGGATVKSTFEQLDEIIRVFPDIYILNLGVVDASTRDIPRWFFKLQHSSRRTILVRISKFIYHGILKRFRRMLVYLRFKSPFIRAKSFERLYCLLVNLLLKETNALIIGMSINIGNERVERGLPGSQNNHKNYNYLIRSCLKRNRCRFLDLTDLDSDIFFPDGIHFSAQGHKKVAERLVQMINEMHGK